ncbi:hypothetical protein J6590_046054 [Homalodisca vitripennis]|nr:hypothetical protein J6590_046054 [Homalodisca vitripennis]
MPLQFKLRSFEIYYTNTRSRDDDVLQRQSLFEDTCTDDRQQQRIIVYNKGYSSSLRDRCLTEHGHEQNRRRDVHCVVNFTLSAQEICFKGHLRAEANAALLVFPKRITLKQRTHYVTKSGHETYQLRPISMDVDWLKAYITHHCPSTFFSPKDTIRAFQVTGNIPSITLLLQFRLCNLAVSDDGVKSTGEYVWVERVGWDVWKGDSLSLVVYHLWRLMINSQIPKNDVI